jgi:hypothetical protein
MVYVTFYLNSISFVGKMKMFMTIFEMGRVTYHYTPIKSPTHCNCKYFLTLVHYLITIYIYMIYHKPDKVVYIAFYIPYLMFGCVCSQQELFIVTHDTNRKGRMQYSTQRGTFAFIYGQK